MLPTDFCIAGFPKCGTTGLARLLGASPCFHVATINGVYEAPFFKRDLLPTSYLPGRINGHKYSMYVRSIENIQKILRSNPECRFLFCVREAKSALLSWRNMHRVVASENRLPWHFTHQSAETREFFINCSLNDYYRQYAGRLLHFGNSLARFQKNCPEARFMVISQGRLGRDTQSVIETLHRHFGVEAPKEYLQTIPATHEAQSDKMKQAEPIAEDIQAELTRMNDDLAKWLETIPPNQNLTLGRDEFAF